jgi:hypothetical protein
MHKGIMLCSVCLVDFFSVKYPIYERNMEAHYLKRNIQTLIDASKEFGLEVNTENKYMLLSCQQNLG